MNVTSAIMSALARNQRKMSIQEIADQEGMAYETVRIHLKAMEQVGLVKSERPVMHKPSRWWIA